MYERKLLMRYSMTITAVASGLALLAATQLPAKAGPTFDLKSTTGMVERRRWRRWGVGGGGGGIWAEWAAATWAAAE